MKHANCTIGFQDRKVMLLLIPLLSFIIPVVFFGLRFNKMPFYTWRIYVTTLILTTSIWLGNRFIMLKARQHFPQFSEVKKRLIIQSCIMLVFTVIVTNTLGLLLHDFCGMAQEKSFPNRSLGDIIINSNNAAFFSSLLVVAIYETVYFMHTLQHSIEEKERIKRESLTSQLNALRTQVNPHFLFNNLNTLSALIPDNPTNAVEFVQQLSKVYRHILEMKDEKSITLKEELDVLKAYAFLLKTRFGNNLFIDFNIEQQALQHKIVPLALQLLMENAIKHNIVSADKPLKIIVHTHGNALIITNNFQVKNQIHDSTGIGLNNIANRYKLLGEYAIKVDNDGNNFTVTIPLIPQ